MKVSLIVTVYNEAKSIAGLLDSVRAQFRQPDEIVIVDAGSKDATREIIAAYEAELPIKLVLFPGCNISEGRNRAVSVAIGEIIASTDAGVRLAPNWLADLVAPIERGEKQIAAGFFVADPRNVFEVAMGAAVLPLAREVDPRTFLPSSRSVAFTKEAWLASGGYPEWLDYCEDLLFDFSLRKLYGPFAWAPQALAYFRPRSSLRSFFVQYYRYSRGDGKANLWFKRHCIRYGTYAAGSLLFASGWRWPGLWLFVLFGAGVYMVGPYRRLPAFAHNLTVLEKLKAALWVPVIRVTGDLAKMTGYPAGLVWRRKHKPPLFTKA